MLKAIQYLKIILPLAAVIALFAFRGYFLDRVSNSMAARHNTSGSGEYYQQYDLTAAGADARGTLIEFGASNCSSCRQMKKVLEEIATRYPGVLNVENIIITEREGLELGRDFGLIAIPMQVLLDREGRVVFRHSGYIATDELIRQINTNLQLN